MADAVKLSFGDGLESESHTTYSVLQRLGAGGNAVTFLVLARSGLYQGQMFALKAFQKLSKPERQESFLEEVNFLQSCNHPAIMRVFDEGTYAGRFPFVVAEYLPTTLRRFMRSRTSIVVKLSVALQLISALRYLARPAEPVVHRDIKPENIFIKDRTCVLGDFGLLKKLSGESDDDREFFKESIGLGMPRWYRSPDLVAYARNEASLQTIARSDVFQLGLVLAELFTGRNPAQRPQGNDFLSPVRLDRLGPVPGDHGLMISNLLNGMLEMIPARRTPVEQLSDLWQGIFEQAARTLNSLEGEVF